MVLVGDVNCLPNVGGEYSVPVDQRLQVPLCLGGFNGILGQRRTCRRHSHGSRRHSAECGRSLRDEINIGEHLARQLVKQLMQLEEVWTLYVPVRLLDLRI
jgi:hypothetical protein